MTADILVLGAGIVGASAAVHLAMRGLEVVVVDRREPGEETSHGNSGIVEPEAFVPVGFPRGARVVLRHALKRTPESNYHLTHLPRLLPWLLSLRRESDARGIARYAEAMWSLTRHARAEHAALAGPAGTARYFRHDGWIRLYRTASGFADAAGLHLAADARGVPYRVLAPDGLAALEPCLAESVHRAVHWPEVDTVSSPGGVTKGIADLARRLGARFLRGDARSLRREGDRWRVDAGGTALHAAAVLVALGPWTTDVTRPLGLRLPMAVKRGYHVHFEPAKDARLVRPILDAELGFVLTPMERGIRLTTGVELADRDALPTPRQIERLVPVVRKMLPLGRLLDSQPWLGRRPAFADSLPVIGPAPGIPGLWLSTGHGHLGFTLGPVSGRLLAEMMTGAPTIADPSPFRAERFHG